MIYLILGGISGLLVSIVINQHTVISNQKYIIKLSQKLLHKFSELNQSPIDLKEISSKDLNPEYAKLVNENWEDLI